MVNSKNNTYYLSLKKDKINKLKYCCNKFRKDFKSSRNLTFLFKEIDIEQYYNPNNYSSVYNIPLIPACSCFSFLLRAYHTKS